MKQLFTLTLFTTLFLGVSCTSDEQQFGSVQLLFNNVVGSQTTDILSPAGSQIYPFVNEHAQTYNLTLVKYIISEIELSGPNGELFTDEIEINLEQVKGAYVIDETKPLSLTVELSNVPVGVYDQLDFTLGVEEEFVQQGATVLLDGMFWAWSAGYIAWKIEGQSPESKGNSFGDTFDETNAQGWAYHVGGWQTPNNNRRISISLDDIQVSESGIEIGLQADAAAFVNGSYAADFSEISSVHDPGSGQTFADNLLEIFSLDYVE